MAEKNGTWMKVSMAVMGVVSLLSVGFAACSTTVALDYRRIDTQGTQKSVMLDTRVTKLETEVSVTLKGMQDTLKGMQDTQKDLTDQLRRHMSNTSSQGLRNGNGVGS